MNNDSPLAQVLAAQLIAKHPMKPLQALAEALLTHFPNGNSEVALAVVSHPDVGVEFCAAEVDEDYFYATHNVQVGKGSCTPIFLIAATGHTDILMRVIDLVDSNPLKQDPHMKIQMLASALCAAAANGHTETIKALVKAGADVNTPYRRVVKFAYTVSQGCLTLVPLNYAARYNEVHAIEVLLELGANVEGNSPSGPLYDAASRGHLQSLEALTKAGASVAKVDDLGDSILHCLARRELSLSADSKFRVLQFLVCKGAVIDHRNKGHQTALHYAAKRASVDVVQSLITLGANIEARDSGGFTPLRRAVVDQGRPTEQYMKRIVRTVQVLLNNGANADFANGVLHRRPLHAVAEWGYLPILELLVDVGIEVDPTDRNRRTPLQLATRLSNDAIVAFLAKEGAKPDSYTIWGVTGGCDVRLY